jgi:phosphate/sulfate permease
LTGQIADFDRECVNFKVDNSVVITVDDQTALDSSEIEAKLPAEILNQLRQQQDLTKAVVAGVLAALLCSILWATFTVYMTIQFRGMALLLGAGVGFAMRRIGKGIDSIFGVAGAIISLVGCVLGNFLSVIGFLAHENDLGYFDTLVRFDYSYLVK